MFFYKKIFVLILISSFQISGMESPSALERSQTNSVLNHQQQQANQAPLVPDDINNPTRWKKIEIKELNIPTGLLKDKTAIRSRHDYLPLKVTPGQLVIWIVIHGTWGSETPDFFKEELAKDDKEPYVHQNFRHIKYNASSYSTMKEKCLNLLSFLWTGENNHEARLDGAVSLYNFLQWLELGQGLKPEINIISHSHGCNVANILSNLVSPERPIHMLIHFGCPVRQLNDCSTVIKNKIKLYNAKNAEIVLLFKSDDWVASLGRDNGEAATIITKTIIDGALPVIATTLAESALTAACPAAGAPLLGLKAYKLSKKAKALISAASVAKSLVSQATRGNGEMELQDGKIRLNIRTQIDGNLPWHTSIPGTSIMDSVEYLMKIIEYLQKHYIYEYSRSGSFNLNIDRLDKQNPIMMTIKERGNAIQPEQIECFKDNKRSILYSDEIDYEECFPIEKKNSEHDAKRFTIKYNGKQIEDNLVESFVHKTIKKFKRP